METDELIQKKSLYSRSSFIKNGLLFTAVAGVSGIGILTQCTEKKDEEREKKQDEKEKKVSPPEDLMQEHGVLNRLLLIYDHCKNQLVNKQSFDMDSLTKSAGIVRSFVEDYHEKHEETYLFPRFKKEKWLPDLIDTLLQQHNAGRQMTDKIMQLTKSKKQFHHCMKICNTIITY